MRQAAEEGEPFDLVLLDAMMPGMDGPQLARTIKADPALGDTRLVILTAVGQRGEVSRLEEIGFAGYLVKPVRPDMLFDCLTTVLGEAANDIGHAASRRMVTRHTLAEDAARARTERGNARILLAEDSITNRQVAVALLDSLGYSADAVTNGREAVEALKAAHYDLVLMDCQMPELDGYEATAEIRKTEGEGKHTPIIAMTASAMKGDRERCIAAGMDDYIAKPVRTGELKETLERRLFGAVCKAPGSPPEGGAGLVFDRDEVLDRLGGDEEMLSEVLAAFFDDASGELAELEEALRWGDAEASGRSSQSLKGSATAVGAIQLYDAACRMEQAIIAGDLSQAQADLERTAKALEEFRDAVMQAGYCAN